jgi:hypothetical protein
MNGRGSVRWLLRSLLLGLLLGLLMFATYIAVAMLPF